MASNRGVPRLRRLPRVGAVWSVASGVLTHPANRSRRFTTFAQAVVAQVKWRLSGKPSEVRFSRSSRVWAHFDGGASQRAAYSPLPDFAEMRVWMHHLAAGDLFIDVGANAGLYTVLGCELGADVIAVEPLDEMVSQTHANLKLNGYHAEVVTAVLGVEAGTAYLDGPDSQRSHLADSGTEVAMTTLDEVIGDRAVAGVKIDVEGFERQVLLGATAALAEQRINLLQLEWNDLSEVNFGESRSVAADVLTSFGYEFFRPNETGHLVRCDATVGSDLFARPADHN